MNRQARSLGVHVATFASVMAALLLLLAPEASARSDTPSVVYGRTTAGCGGGTCHGTAAPTVVITGPSALDKGESQNYTITLTRTVTAQQFAGIGVRASPDATVLDVVMGQKTVKYDGGMGPEIVHDSNVGAGQLPSVSNTDNDTTYLFKFNMPANAATGSSYTINAVGAIDYAGGWAAATPYVVKTRPTALSSLTASGITASTVNLAWSGTGAGPAYRVVRKTTGVPASPTDGTYVDVSSTSTTITGLAGNTLYYFAVYSKLSGEDIFSSTAPSTTATTSAPMVATRYVNAASGTNSGACLDQANPCKTITYAMSVAASGNPGDAISVAPGTYNQALGEVFPIAIKNGVALTGSGTPATVIVDAMGANQRVFTVSTSNSYTLLQGFTIKGGRPAPPTSSSDAYGGAMFIGPPFAQSAEIRVNGNIFTDNEVRGHNGTASTLYGYAAYGGAIAAYVSTGSAPVISNNLFVNNRAIGGNGYSTNSSAPAYAAAGGIGGAIAADGSGPSGANAVTIVNNTFYGNVAQGGVGGSSATGAGGDGGGSLAGAMYLRRAIVRNNIFASNSALGGAGGTGSPAGLSGAGSGGSVANGEASVTSTNNLFFGNNPSAGEPGTAGILADPLFTSAPGDLRPIATSPARAAGTATNAPTTDFDGLTRPTPPSIGAYEPRPTAPSSVTASNIRETSLDLAWSGSGSGPHYRVVYKAGASAPTGPADGTVLDLGAATSTTVTGLNPATQYTFAVYSKFNPETIFSATAAATTVTTSSVMPRYVNAATGVNTGNCTVQASPCKTITYAMAQAPAGVTSTINVAPGTYNVGLGEVFPISFKSGVELVATGTPANTIIDAAGDTAQGGIFSAFSPAGGRIEGFTIANAVYQAGQYAGAQGGAMRIYSASGTFTLTRNVFSNNEARGFPGLAGFNYGGGSALGGAIYASFSSSIVITNNVFTGNVARGGNGLSHGGAFVGQENGGSGQGGVLFLDSVGGTVANNTFYGNSAIGGNGGTASSTTGNGGDAIGGAMRFNGSNSVTLVNNAFVANAANAGTGGTPGSASGGAGASGSNSLLFGNTVNGVSSGETGAVNLDPQFLSPPTNLRIPNSSPAKAAGTATGAPATDHDGATRPNPPSIGAFEPATSITYNLVLEGYQQVGPYVATPATGSGTAIFNTGTKQLTFNLAYSGLSSAETAAHIHGPAARGANAAPLVTLSAANPKQDVVTLSASQETQLYAGQLYVNIHTSTYGAGELRAQIDNAGATTTRVLSVTKSGAGTGTVTGTTEAGTVVNCGSDCTETIPNGKVATLTATPTGGSVFVGWSGACTGTGTCQVTMDASKNVDANFFAVVPRYVNAATGANAGNCSSSSAPCKTITYAMSQASSGPPGDPINVAPGTYNVGLGEVFPIVFKSGVELQSTGTPANTIIDGAGDTVRKGLITAVVGGGGRIEGFTLTNGVHEAAQITQGGAVRIFGVSTGSFTVTRNVFSNNEARGGLALGGALYVSSTSGSGSISVTNNVFVGNVARGFGSDFAGNAEGGGIYFEVPVNGSATNNTFHGNSAIGRNNSGVAGGNARGGGAAGNSTLTIVNNIFSANSATAGTGSPAGTATAGAAATASGSSGNNLSFGNLVNGAASTGDSLGTGTVTQDPLFFSAPTNLRIPNASPAKAAGTATGAPATDHDGVTRPNPPSIGAFEPSSLAPTVALGSTSINFGGQSMGTTSPATAVTLSNTGNSTLTVSSVTVSNAQFAQSNNCTSVAAGASCTINVTFTPAVAGGALNSTAAVSGTLTITSNASGSPHAVSLAGSAEKSLVSHYYRSILRRAPDAGGKAFWQAEAARVAALGANVNEVWFSLSGTFYTSAEYLAQNRNNTGFATDLYNTFFNRAPDSGGLGYWVSQLDSGLPREVLLAQFMFSAEFGNFSRAIFGNTAVRAEMDAVMDFYRGILGRLPDDGGFNYWVGRFRAAQCQGQAAIVSEVEAISSAFALSGEYAARGRTNAQYVGDLYNAFLRRGGELGGVQFWINEIVTGARSRENVRVEFKNSPEFQARVNAIIQQGCLS